MKYTVQNYTFWLLLLLCTCTLIPFLGLPEYYSDGEPRESVVSYTMFIADDWVLPRNNGGEMAYKPPFFHWCVAVASILRGDMTEGATRVPSAVALIGMTLWGFGFFARRRGTEVGMLAVLVAFTAAELHREGSVCRVDMVLTASIVCALYMLYQWFERDMRDSASLILGILLMGVGTLTKGPVGTLMPCMVMGVYMLLRGVNFFRAFGLLAAWALLSLVPYALWFYAAWLQGGQEFLDLVYQENIGRMVGTMGNGASIEPWYYNVQTVVLGFLPWTAMLLVSLGFLHYGRPDLSVQRWWQSLRRWVRQGDPVDVFAATVIVVVFVFYCIPMSKRAAYLMPVYPFLSYFVARYMLWMASHARRVMRIHGSLLAGASLLLFVVYAVVQSGVIPDALFGHGTYSPVAVRTLHALADANQWWQWLLVLTPTAFGCYWIFRRKYDDMHNIYAVFFLTFGIYLAVDGVFAPAVLNSLSVRTTSIQINHAVPASEGTLYEYKEDASAGAPVHFYEINFYLRNRIRNFLKEQPAEGFLLITRGDAERHLPEFRRRGYQFTLRHTADRRELRVYAFSRKQPES